MNIERKDYPDIGFNDFPPEWREMSEKEFAQSPFFTYLPDFFDLKQMISKNSNTSMVQATLYWYKDKTGYALVNDWQKGKVRFFAFGCKHEWNGKFTDEEWKTLFHSQCVHHYKCSKCGAIQSYDSSD